MTRVPVLEIGGTHVTAAVVDTAAGRPVAGSVVRRPVAAGAGAGAAELLDSFAEAAGDVAEPGMAHWGVAVPGPFDYASGVGRFRGIGKFESLDGVDVGAGLLARMPYAETIGFLNDADAFALGEHHSGAAAQHGRSVCVTLGTGVGSSFLRDGRPVTEGPDVPPDGRAHHITVDGLPLEEVVSRKAVRARYARSAGLDGTATAPDVRAIAELARAADPHAVAAIDGCFTALGRALAPWCAAFRPDVMVVGGSMAASWDLIGPALRTGLTAGAGAEGPRAAAAVATMALRTARRPDDAPLIGAAQWVLTHHERSHPPAQGPSLAGSPAAGAPHVARP
ncbi:ROK family protein [Streptomyces sp. NPDC086010]|uniref:ROK family protein n=1 Tax=Streptomyces sp. NPDC086010 TaxID=3365745 RepID=UPI0037D3D18B